MGRAPLDLATPPLAGFAAGLPLRLRTELEDDAGFLMELHRAMQGEEMIRAGFGPVFTRLFLDYQFMLQRDYYRANYKGAGFFVIEKEEERLGRIYIHPSRSDYRLVDIGFMPQWRNRGFGGCLISALQSHAAGRGAKVSLHVDPENRAARLYARLGFVVVDRDSPHWRMEWQA